MIVSGPVSGQDTLGPFQRAEQEAQQELEEQETGQLSQTLWGQLSYRYGGWTRFTSLGIEDESTISTFNPNDRFRRDVDNRWWVQFNAFNHHQVYFRYQMQIIDNSPGDQFTGEENQQEWEIDQLYYRGNLNGIAKRHLGLELPMNLEVKAGRQSLTLGSGLVYNRVHDGVKLSGSTDNVSVALFGARSKLDEFNIDSSLPDFEISRRFFYGAQVNYQELAMVEPYAFGLIQQDDTPERPADPNREYDYNSSYIGTGFLAEPLSNFSLEAEGIYQDGESHSDGSGAAQTEEDIRAYAWLLSGTYYANVDGAPEANIEYIVGSGDPDRGTVTDTVGGNEPGTTDENFLYFGFRPVGLALNPRISNIRIWKAGASIQPFKRLDEEFKVPYKNVKLGFDVFHYRKFHEEGAISDVRASEEEKDLGWEWDLYANWRVFSDTTIQIRYGRFHPGQAYLERNERDFISFHTTINY